MVTIRERERELISAARGWREAERRFYRASTEYMMTDSHKLVEAEARLARAVDAYEEDHPT